MFGAPVNWPFSVLPWLAPASASCGIMPIRPRFLWATSGALALGGILGTVALATKQEILLALVGGIFVVEALSVIIQVTFFKVTNGRRIFRMAPIHHHYELKGWPEPKVIVRFWILAVILGLLALSTLKLR